MNVRYDKLNTMLPAFLLFAAMFFQTAGFASGESLSRDTVFQQAGSQYNGSQHNGRFENNLDQVKKEMKPLNFLQDPAHKPSGVSYFQYYDFDYKNMRHFWGTFNTGNYTIAAHVFVPDNPKGSVILLHGFFDHSGTMKNLIRHCLDRQYAVAVYDLPGHGLSSGKRLLVDDFSEYVSVLEDFIKICKPHLMKPFHLICHSTGCAIAFEYLNNTNDIIFKKIVFLAPLVHFTSWNITKVGYFIAKPFVKSLPRKFRKNSSDPVFMEKYKNDPLRSGSFPLKWLNALYKWDRRIKGYKPVSKHVLVIQGTGDKVVDWKYNIEFLEKKLRKMEVKWIQNAKHQLLNEKESVKSEVLKIITKCLEG